MFFLCSFLYLHKETNQRKCSRSLAASLLVRLWRTALYCSQRANASESRGVYTPLRGAPPNRFSALCYAARLREMAITEKISRLIYYSSIRVVVKFSAIWRTFAIAWSASKVSICLSCITILPLMITLLTSAPLAAYTSRSGW
jgi:hypothetical protein